MRSELSRPDKTTKLTSLRRRIKMSPEIMGLLYAAQKNTKKAVEIYQSNKNAHEKSIK
jgi:hypothetical protein